MLRSKRTFFVAFSLALGVLAVAAIKSFDLLPKSEGEGQLVNTAAGRPKPQPTAGEGSSGSTGGTAPTAGPDVISIPTELLPAEAAIYVEISSIEAISRVVRDLVGRVDPAAAVMMDTDQLLGQMLSPFGAQVSDMDKRRPLGLALVISDQGEPRPTLLLPVNSPEDFKSSLQLPLGFAEPRVAARYVGLTLGPSYPVSRGAAPIGLGFAPATVNARILIDPVREQVMAGMEQARLAGGAAVNSADPSSSAAYEYGQDFAYKVISATDHLDLAIDLDQERFAFQMGVGFTPGSSMVRDMPEDPADLEALAAFASPEDELALVAGWDRAFFDGALRPFLDDIAQLSMSEEDEAAFDQAEAVMAFLPTLGEEIGVFASFEVGAAHLALVSRPLDSDTMLGMASVALSSLDREHIPVAIGAFSGVDIEDGRAARLTIDLATPHEGESSEDARIREMIALLFGANQIELQLTSRGGWLIATLGADPQWRDEMIAATGAEPSTRRAPEGLAAMLDHARGASPGFAYQLDLVGIQRNLLTLMAEQMGLDSSAELARFDGALGSEPLTFAAYGAVVADRWTTGIEVDLERLMTLIELTK